MFRTRGIFATQVHSSVSRSKAIRPQDDCEKYTEHWGENEMKEKNASALMEQRQKMRRLVTN